MEGRMAKFLNRPPAEDGKRGSDWRIIYGIAPHRL